MERAVRLEVHKIINFFSSSNLSQASNKLYYQTQEKADLVWFRARPEAEKYLDRDHYEKKILEFIYSEFSYYTKKEDEGPKLQNKDVKIV